MVYLITSLIVLSLLGIIDASYISLNHLKKKSLICPINETCNIVTESKWSSLFYFRNDSLGVIYYAFILITSLVLFFTNLRIIRILLIFSSGFAFLFSIFLVYLQVKAIKNYCFYCLISALLSLLIFVNIIFIFISN